MASQILRNTVDLELNLSRPIHSYCSKPSLPLAQLPAIASRLRLLLPQSSQFHALLPFRHSLQNPPWLLISLRLRSKSKFLKKNRHTTHGILHPTAFLPSTFLQAFKSFLLSLIEFVTNVHTLGPLYLSFILLGILFSVTMPNT